MRNVLLIAFSFLSTIAYATTYFVSPTGNDFNPGTFDKPFNTIEFAESIMRGGDTLYVREGTYREAIRFAISGGNSAKPTVIMAFEGESPTIDGTGIDIGRGSALIEIASDHTYFEGFEVINSLEYGIHLRGSNCKVSHCIIDNTVSLGIMGSGDFAVIEDCEVCNTSMKNENGQSPATWSNAIRLADQSSPIYGAVVRRCIVHDGWGEGIAIAFAESCIVEDCIIYDTYSVLLYCRNSQNCLIQRNLVYMTKDMGGVSSPGIGHWNETTAPYRNEHNRFINNMVYNCDRNFNHRHNTEGLIVVNNTFVNSRQFYNVFMDNSENINGLFINNLILQEDDLPCIYFDADPNVTFSHNLYNKNYDQDAAGPGDTIADPKIAKTGDQGPGELSGTYFKLLNDSPAIDNGLENEFVTSDYFENPRSNPPDIGAHEFYTIDPPVQVTAIRILVEEGSTSTIPGSILHLSADITPSNATEKTVSWSIIEGTDLATIDSEGVFTALKPGIVTVKATATDGSQVFDIVNIIIEDVNTSVNENTSDHKMMIYPNPAQNYFTVFISDNTLLPLQLKILSYMGSIVDELIIFSGSTEIPIRENIINGVYIVKLTKEDLNYTSKKLAVSR